LPTVAYTCIIRDSSIERRRHGQDFQNVVSRRAGLIVVPDAFRVGQFAADARGADENKKGPSVTQKNLERPRTEPRRTLFTAMNSKGATMQVTDYGRASCG